MIRGGFQRRSALPPAALFSAALLGFALAGTALAAPPDKPAPRPLPVTVLDRQLAPTRGGLVSIDGRTVLLVDDLGVRKSVALTDVLAIVSDAKAPVVRSSLFAADEPASDRGWITFTDGQTLRGSVTQASAPESVAWKSDALGDLQRPIEEVRTIVLDGPEPRKRRNATPWSGNADEVVYRNGDRTEGFVSVVGPIITIEKDNKPAELPVDRVFRLRFANPPAPKRGTYLWLSDGSVVKADTVRAADGQLELSFGKGPGSPSPFHIPTDRFDGLLTDAGRVTPLASLEFEPGPATGDRRWTAPPRVGPSAPLGLSEIDLPGPMSVEWTLPPRAERVGAEFVLPPECRVWGDCRVIVESGKAGAVKELFSARLNGSAPEAAMAVAVTPGSPLRVRLEEGEGGPIQDRIVIRRGLIVTR